MTKCVSLSERAAAMVEEAKRQAAEREAERKMKVQSAEELNARLHEIDLWIKSVNDVADGDVAAIEAARKLEIKKLEADKDQLTAKNPEFVAKAAELAAAAAGLVGEGRKSTLRGIGKFLGAVRDGYKQVAEEVKAGM